MHLRLRRTVPQVGQTRSGCRSPRAGAFGAASARSRSCADSGLMRRVWPPPPRATEKAPDSSRGESRSSSRRDRRESEALRWASYRESEAPAAPVARPPRARRGFPVSSGTPPPGRPRRLAEALPSTSSTLHPSRRTNFVVPVLEIMPEFGFPMLGRNVQVVANSRESRIHRAGTRFDLREDQRGPAIGSSGIAGEARAPPFYFPANRTEPGSTLGIHRSGSAPGAARLRNRERETRPLGALLPE